MKPTDKGYYRPFVQTERDCKKCRKYIEKVQNRNGEEYMRCEIAPTITVPYISDGIKCAGYEEIENGR